MLSFLDTQSVDYDVAGANTAVEAVANVSSNPSTSGNLSFSGLHPAIRERVRGSVVAFKVSNDRLMETWGVDQVVADVEVAGRRRV